MNSWDDLRTVLEISRSGSLSGAARQLGVSHATVFRRLRNIERRLGVLLFERSPGGYQPTLAGEEMAQAAARVHQEVEGVTRRIQGAGSTAGGRHSRHPDRLLAAGAADAGIRGVPATPSRHRA